MHKQCSKCGVEKSLSDFYKNSDGRLGVSAQCKTCLSPVWAPTKARYRAANPERYAQEIARFREARRARVAAR